MKLPNKTIKKLFLFSSVSFVAASVVALGLLLSSTTTAGAQSQVFTAIPPRLEVLVNPGDNINKIIQFRNEGDETAYLVLAVNDFIVTGSNGQPEFVGSPVSGRWSASSWIKVSPTNVAVPPKATVNLTASISVPLDALPGGHYAGVLYQSSGSPASPGAGVGAGTGINQTVGTLAYITVAGPITENAFLKQFKTPGFSEYGPVEFTTEILNQSDIHIAPQGQITVRDMLGKTVKVLPLEQVNIFPQASRIYENIWDVQYLIGRYRADLEVAYGEHGRAITATIFFWVFPWKIVSVAFLAIIIIILLVLLTTKQIRKRQEKLEEKLFEEESEIAELKKQIKNQSE